MYSSCYLKYLLSAEKSDCLVNTTQQLQANALIKNLIEESRLTMFPL